MSEGPLRFRLPVRTVTGWLLNSDPSIRWQVLRDVLHESNETVAAERARMATEGWGAQLLALQVPDRRWDRGTYNPPEPRDPDAPGQPWTATHHSLILLREFGLDPANAEARTTIDLARENGRWEHNGQRYFNGEVGACIDGLVVAIGDYFGVDVQPVVDRLLDQQLDDGGWNCNAEYGFTRSSFHTTICVLEGLLQHEQSTGASAEVSESRRRAEGYLLEQRMLRRLSTGASHRHRCHLFLLPHPLVL